MKIAVCVRQGLDGELSPFDASAYEAALRIPGAEVTLVSMGPASVKDFLLRLTRLGAKRAILLCDPAFAGADTIATAYTLSFAIKKIAPDLVFCGRQTLVGDTAQTGPMLSVMCGLSLISGVMSIDSVTDKITCNTREEGICTANLPALITVERIHNLRLPSILSKVGTVEVLTSADLSIDTSRTGLRGSPTRVKKTFENASGKRKCKFISKEELRSVIDTALSNEQKRTEVENTSSERLDSVWCVTDAPIPFAKMVSDDITVIDMTDEHTLAKRIVEEKPSAVLFGSDSGSKALSARVSALLGLGLCADCTSLDVEAGELVMIRPALSGSVIARIVSLTKPAMATVRTVDTASRIVVSAGYGARGALDSVKAFAEELGAELSSTRKAVDNDLMPYATQVGLTGKTVSPAVYVTFGVSGAVHHIVGMQRSGTVIAINTDKDAPIFEYADYGILSSVEDVLEK